MAHTTQRKHKRTLTQPAPTTAAWRRSRSRSRYADNQNRLPRFGETAGVRETSVARAFSVLDVGGQRLVYRLAVFERHQNHVGDDWRPPEHIEPDRDGVGNG